MIEAAAIGAADLAALGADGSARFRSTLDRLQNALVPLPDKPAETPASTLRALWLLAAGYHVSVEGAVERTLVPLDDVRAARLERMLELRLTGTPLAHLTRRQRFMGLDFEVGAQALIPRRETELLGETALSLLPAGMASPRVVDVCTGCGNLAAAIATRRSDAQVFASDLSPEAVALARRNVESLGLQGRVTLAEGDLLAPFDTPAFLGQVDLLVCNPPYISSGRLATMPGEIVAHEPRMAFDGGPFGVRLVQRLLQEAPRFLRPGGWLAFEIGLGQAPAVARRLTPALGYASVRTVDDAAGAPRVVVAQALTA